MSKIENESNLDDQSSGSEKPAELASELRDIASSQSGDQASQDGRLDHDTAWDVGHASKAERSEEAYHRQYGKLSSEALAARDQLSREQMKESSALEDSAYEMGSMDNLDERKKYDERQKELRKIQKAEEDVMERGFEARGRDLNDIHSGADGRPNRYTRSSSMDLLVDQGYYDQQHENLDAANTKGRVGNAAERAERKEKWAEALARHPELANGRNAADIISIEDEIDRYTYLIEDSESKLESFQAQLENGTVNPFEWESQLGRGNAEIFGQMCRDANRTVGELQQFIRKSLEDTVDAARQGVARRRSYLDQLQA